MKQLLLSSLAFYLSGLVACRHTPENTLTHSNKANHEHHPPDSAAPKTGIKTIGILLYDGLTPLDAIGPYQVLSELTDAEIKLIAPKKGLIKASGGLRLEAAYAMHSIDKLDLLLVPGGFRSTYTLAKDTAVTNWVRRIDSNTRYTASVCTGAWVLGGAGLLRDKNATTHWYGKDILEKEYGAHYQPRRWVHDGKYWTSAGVTAGMDMCLALVGEIAGERYARTAMLDLEYAPQPPFTGGTEFNTDPDIVKTLRDMYDASLGDLALPAPKPETRATPATRTTGVHPFEWATDLDLICNMSIDHSTPDTAHYLGKIYGFCCSGCKETFQENPKYWVEKQPEQH